MMSQNLEKLKCLLAELFQLDQTELDFGIYRIMNTKREEIVRFLDRDLLPQVREVLAQYEKESRAAIAGDLEKAMEQAKALGFDDPAQAPRVKELQTRYNAAFDLEAAESEVYSHLYNFFRRYYSEGDFISQRRYKEGVYAIPYEGEEVKLYWANHDQYYIKTSEYLRNYTFTLPSGKRVHFKLAEADTEKDNNRPVAGNERRFILSAEQPVAEENGELIIRFEFKPDPQKRKQADLNAAAVDRILNQTTGFDDWRQELAALRPTEKNPNRTLLEKHLTDYTARNTFDYFIHKDLAGFLRRELDFYIKNEVMHLDDIENEAAPRVEQYLSKIKAIRRIAHKIIDFLAQIENFQKKLWLKKKFVVETQYCITLDRILAIEDEKARDWLIDQIIANDAQREEWVRLFAINEIKGDLTTPGYSKPLKPEFLKAHPTLVVDTRHFDEAFKLRLLAAIPDLDEATDGLLIHSENFQALNLLQARYREQVKCIYIDPPYNTGHDEFTYKDAYQHSSWLTMLMDRLLIALALLRTDGSIFVNSDDSEQARLKLVMDALFGHDNFLASVVWEKVHTRKNSARYFSVSHDYIVAYAKLKSQWDRILLPREDTTAYSNPDNDPKGPWKPDPVYANNPYDADYVITKPNGVTLRPPPGQYWRFSEETFKAKVAKGEVVWGEGSSYPMVKRYLSEVQEGLVPVTLFTRDFAGDNMVANAELNALFGEGRAMSYPKPTLLVRRIAQITTRLLSRELVLDFFAGSGTTGHAVINLNREDGGRRKFILVEMGEYFDTVLVPRIKNVIFSPEWKDGKPKRMPTPEEVERSPRIVKILRLESYEDTLNNLELKRTEAQQSLLEQHPAFREDYVLRYMLDVESRGSASLLNIDRFEDPFNYTLNIATGTAGETKPTVVDLVETFNYLIGLRVKTIDHIGGVRVVTGTNQQGERVLVLWRNTKELDNDALDAWFREQSYNTQDQEYDVIYVNGDNNLENLRKPDQTWKVRLIEEEFRRLMFDVQDV
jgi:adenine-specific DNA-methyltransferase